MFQFLFIFFIRSLSLVGHSHLNILKTQIKANRMTGLSFMLFVPVIFTFVLCSRKARQQHRCLLHPDLDTGHIHASWVVLLV